MTSWKHYPRPPRFWFLNPKHLFPETSKPAGAEKAAAGGRKKSADKSPADKKVKASPSKSSKSNEKKQVLVFD
jgi:hypothetical protein